MSYFLCTKENDGPQYNTRDMHLLDPNFLDGVHRVRHSCLRGGVDILFYCALRSPWQQARYYRQGRSKKEIGLAVTDLNSKGWAGLADILLLVGPQYGQKKITHARPGESWHQYGLAVDGVPLFEGRCIWDDNITPEIDEWGVYIGAAEGAGLVSGAEWGDKPHIQTRRPGSDPYPNPLICLEEDKIISEFEERGWPNPQFPII